MELKFLLTDGPPLILGAPQINPATTHTGRQMQTLNWVSVLISDIATYMFELHTCMTVRTGLIKTERDHVIGQWSDDRARQCMPVILVDACAHGISTSTVLIPL